MAESAPERLPIPFGLSRLLRAQWGIALTALIAAAALIRHASLGHGLWINEVVSAQAARLPWPSLLHRTGFFDIYPPFYYLVLSAWTAVFGDLDIALRMLSLLLALGGLVVAYFLGRLWSRWVGLLAVLILTFSTFHAHYSTEVRAESLLILLSSLFFLQYETLMRRDALSPGFFLGLALVESALVLTHYYGAILLLVANAHFFTVRRFDGLRLFRWSMVQTFSFAAFLAWAPLMLVQLFHLPEAMYAGPLESSDVLTHALFLGLSPVHPARLIAWLSSFLILSATAVGLAKSLRHDQLTVRTFSSRAIHLPRRQTLITLAAIALCLAAPALAVLIMPTTESTAPLLYQELPRSYLLAFAGLFLLLMGNLYNLRGAGAGHRLPATAALLVGTATILLALYFLHRPFQPRNWSLLLVPGTLLAASSWEPKSVLGRLTVVALLISLAIPSLERRDRTFLPRQDFRGAANLIRAQALDERGTANFVLPMWDRPGLEYYLGTGTANGIMSPAQLPPTAYLPQRVNIVLTRRAFDEQALFLDTFASVLGPEFVASESGQSFSNVVVTVFERRKRDRHSHPH